MVKAVFLDYNGTLMQEENRYALELAGLIKEHSSLESIREIIGIWWSLVKKYEAECYGECFLTEDEIVTEIIKDLMKTYDLVSDKEPIFSLIHNYWAKSPAFEDVPDFFDNCRQPVFILTNNSPQYVQTFLEDNHLHCNGIISGEMVRAYKPHREIFEKALEVSGCNPDEVMHVGDSVRSDVNGALAVGIRPCLLDRNGTKKQENTDTWPICVSLRDVLRFL